LIDPADYALAPESAPSLVQSRIELRQFEMITYEHSDARSRANIRHLRRDRLGGLIHEYLQVA
jgi:hypothetical protein